MAADAAALRVPAAAAYLVGETEDFYSVGGEEVGSCC